MRLNIVYVDYKNEKLHNQLIIYSIKNEIKSNTDYTLIGHSTTPFMNINKTFLVSDNVTEYLDKNGSIGYKIAIVPQYIKKKKIDKLDKTLNSV